MRYTGGEMTVLRNVLALGLLGLLASGAQAERFLFQRGTGLYLATREGKEARKLLDIGPGHLWSASPDGRRIVWLKPAAGDSEGGLDTRPATVYLADITGRRQKKLFSTDALTDRQGRKVTALGPLDAGGVQSALAEWSAVSLSWSADGRTLYLGCTRVGPLAGLATVTVDAQAGTAIVDADGNWKTLAAVTQVDARGTALAGVSLGKLPGGAPLATCNLALGNTWTQLTAGEDPPSYGMAQWPALAPDSKSVAFASQPRGLWLAEGTKLRRLINGEVVRPRFGEDSKTILFLAPRPTTTDKQSYDLFELAPGATAPKVVLSDVDWFDVVPD